MCIIVGYCLIRLDDLPRAYHDSIVEKLDSVIEKGGNPGNNMLPMVPELQTMLKHPKVNGALRSILGMRSSGTCPGTGTVVLNGTSTDRASHLYPRSVCHICTVWLRFAHATLPRCVGTWRVQ